MGVGERTRLPESARDRLDLRSRGGRARSIDTPPRCREPEGCRRGRHRAGRPGRQHRSDALAARLTALDRALALPNAPVGGLQFERAWELFALDRREEAEAAYYAGAGEPDSLGRALYRQDIAYIADSTELRAWDQAPAAARAGW